MSSFFERFFATPEVIDTLSDQAVIEAMLRFEAALARAQASAGLIPQAAALSIIGTCKVELFDCPKLVRESARSRCMATPLVQSLRETVALFNPQAADFVHFGCSVQDLVDTALALVMRDVLKRIEVDLAATLQSLLALAEKHAHDPMLERNPMQPASITSFGLLCSQWAAPLVRDRQRMCAASASAMALRLANDLVATADMQDQHMQVMALMAADLQLQEPAFAGNTAHDEVVALACALGLLTGNLGHTAACISHMVQFEIGELIPAPASGALASGAPAMQTVPLAVMCMTVLAHAHRVPQQVAMLLATLSQERTSLPGHWQAQLAQWPALLTACQSITSTSAQLVAGMQADTQRMRSNLDAVRASLPAKEIKARFSNDLLKHASRLAHTQIKALRNPPSV